VLSTAVPSVVADIGGFEAFPWLFTTYLLAQAVTVPVYSKLGDMFGRKPILLFGIGVFLLGSILCALAPSMLLLIVFRAVQGLGAGAISPMVLTIPGDIYSIEERARVQGYLSSVWAIAAVLGPTIGGLFAQYVDWRWIFWINVPLCLLAAFLIWRDFRENFERREHRIDVAGALLLTLGLTALLLGILEGGVAWDWVSPISLAVFGTAAALLVAFVLVERRAKEPVLPIRVLTRRVVLSAILTAGFIGIALIGLNTYLPTYLQISLDVAPIVAGLTLAALAIGWPLASTLSGRVYMRFGFRATCLTGTVVTTLAAAALAIAGPTPNLAIVAVLCFTIGLGLGLTFAPMLIAAQSSVPWRERGVVTGAIMFLRNGGSAIGAAIAGAIANAVVASHGGDASEPSTIIPAATAVFVVVAVAAGITILTVALQPSSRGAAPLDSPPATP
jgi:EmrB/QacA subfamily drug resistance transporter